MDGGRHPSTNESFPDIRALHPVDEVDNEHETMSDSRPSILTPKEYSAYNMEQFDCPMTPTMGPSTPLTPRTSAVRAPLTPVATTPRMARYTHSGRMSMAGAQGSPQAAMPPRILLMPRRSEPQLQQFHAPPLRTRSSTSAFHFRRQTSVVDLRPRLAPLKSKARPSEKEKMENEVLPDEMVDHMFAMTPRSTSSSAAQEDNDFHPSQSPIAVIEAPAHEMQMQYEEKMDCIMSSANHLGVAVFVDMMLKLVMFLVFMTYIDPIRMVFSIFGYSSSFSFSIRQYFMFITFCAFDILLLVVWGWNDFGDKQLYRTILGVSNIVILALEMAITTRLLVLLRSLTPEQFLDLHER
ncbi:Aste57867_23209 [Aphanomyces stellatus]|uniref:Aste57867_23209 protein n=1 Tax=Aphanomyces stellatus TaxID=120398 RepID=A0A485LMY9_9STRA|nr:hypothetical protein As57867_023138 [Aphanomyces stellatus]VFT99856.1 Aste57867_23209 [Aphanomyces stellatus]